MERNGNEKGQKRNRTVARVAVFVASELIWGMALSAFLQYTAIGRWLSRRRAWVAVVIGVGGTQALASQVTEIKPLLWTTAGFCLSSLGIIARSLVNEQRLERVLCDAKDKSPTLG